MGRDNTLFILTLSAFSILCYAISGERLIDLAFSMPDFGGADDQILDLLFVLEDTKVALGLVDHFGVFRGWLHKITELG